MCIFQKMLELAQKIVRPAHTVKYMVKYFNKVVMTLQRLQNEAVNFKFKNIHQTKEMPLTKVNNVENGLRSGFMNMQDSMKLHEYKLKPIDPKP